MSGYDWRFWGLVVLGVGVALSGAFAGYGFSQGRVAERFVTVKGVSEREVEADLAVWPLQITAADNNLDAVNRQLAQGVSAVHQFMARHGLDTTQVALTGYYVEDAEANQYSMGPARNRFVARQTMVIRSTSPTLVLAASQRVSELTSAGVAISSAGGTDGPTFVFTRLNDLKPEMIAEATRDARKAAEQFAEDSGSKAGSIRNAQQGYFSIDDRDAFSPEYKRIRVVTTVQFFLED